MVGRILSITIGLTYVVLVYVRGSPGVSLGVGLYCLAAIAAIWHSDSMGSYDGGVFGRSITSMSLGPLLLVAGWAALLLPGIVGVITALLHNP